MKHVRALSVPRKAADLQISTIISLIATILSAIAPILADKEGTAA
jgi:hypothetical protein